MDNDLIRRDAALQILCENCTPPARCKIPCNDYKMISQLSAVDAEPVRHGRWVQDYELYEGMEDWSEAPFVRCSECAHKEYGADLNDYTAPDDLPNYCPNCGAKMDLEAQKDDQGMQV